MDNDKIYSREMRVKFSDSIIMTTSGKVRLFTPSDKEISGIEKKNYDPEVTILNFVWLHQTTFA